MTSLEARTPDAGPSAARVRASSEREVTHGGTAAASERNAEPASGGRRRSEAKARYRTCARCERRRPQVGMVHSRPTGNWYCPPGDDETCEELFWLRQARKAIIERADLNPHLDHHKLPFTLEAIDRDIARLEAS